MFHWAGAMLARGEATRELQWDITRKIGLNGLGNEAVPDIAGNCALDHDDIQRVMID